MHAPPPTQRERHHSLSIHSTLYSHLEVRGVLHCIIGAPRNHVLRAVLQAPEPLQCAAAAGARQQRFVRGGGLGLGRGVMSTEYEDSVA